MTRERMARIALCAYPADARAADGEEMLATVLDAGASSRRRFAREIVDLVRLGLRATAMQTASAGPRRLVADGLCLAGVWLMTVDLTIVLAWRYRGLEGPLVAWGPIALLAVALALALVGLDRLGGAAALLWTAMRLPDLMREHPGAAGLAVEALPVVCFAIMILAPRRRDRDLSRLAWLIVPAVLVVTFGPRGDERDPLLLAAVVLATASAIAFAVALLPTDPRMAIAGAVGLSQLAVGVVGLHHDVSLLAWASLAAAPVAVAVATARTHGLRRRAPI
jgi:hypothetical protein